MYNSGVSAGQLIEDLQSEVDVAKAVPVGSYVTWLNGLEQLLYSEIVKEMGLYTKTNATASLTMPIDPSVSTQGHIRFEDICGVYSQASGDSTSVFEGGGFPLTLVTPTSARNFNNVYYNLGGNLYYKTSVASAKIILTYYVRPKPKDGNDVASLKNVNVMLPVEFLDLAKAKLRSEAYKLMNEDGLAAKWMNDYNYLLEMFKGWVEQRRPRFGVN